MTEEQFDVVVVGGGPAGSMAARGAAEQGARTLLLERDANIGLPVRCGEGVAITGLQRFMELDPRWIAAHLTGLKMYAPDGTGVLVNIKDQFGVVLERAIFDRHLAELAATAGAEIRTKCDVTGLHFEQNEIRGLYYRRMGVTSKISAGLIVAADGVESRLGRWAGIKCQIKACDLESAYQQVLTNLDFDHTNAHFYFGSKIAPGGYIWVFPKGEKTANVGIGVQGDLCRPGEAYTRLRKFIDHHFGTASVVGEMAGAVPCAPPLKEPFTDGLILAGDAAHHCNPLTGGGISSALVSGYEVGKLAAEAVACGNRSKAFLAKINNRLEDKFLKAYRRAYRIAQAVTQLSDESMNRTAQVVLSIPEDKRTLNKIFLKGLIAFPKLMIDIMRAFT